jgi:DNA polymerase zeta
VKLGTYASDSTLPPGARVALRMMAKDPSLAPAHQERVPYVVVNETGAQLKDMVRHPMALLAGSDPPTINGDHYMAKHIIPSMNRIFGLVGVDVGVWYRQMPRARPRRSLFSLALVTWSPSDPAARPVSPQAMQYIAPGRRGGLEAYYQHADCVGCATGKAATPPTEPPVCSACLSKSGRPAAYAKAVLNMQDAETTVMRYHSTCNLCVTVSNVSATAQ